MVLLGKLEIPRQVHGTTCPLRALLCIAFATGSIQSALWSRRRNDRQVQIVESVTRMCSVQVIYI